MLELTIVSDNENIVHITRNLLASKFSFHHINIEVHKSNYDYPVICEI